MRGHPAEHHTTARVWQLVALGGFFSACFLAAALGSAFTSMSVETWYPTLAKPVWTPSGKLIGAVWSVLYTLMGLSAWLVWTRGFFTFLSREAVWFSLQLLLNVSWSALFFGLRSPGLAVINIGILWAAILVTTILFWAVSRPAGYLLMPYLAWVSFASVLNIMIWRMNC
ncbi:MAG: translocator protein [Thermodesulfobacteriota bacterium]|nr:translocator protein [Thermodesulfobacteriota bacterium]